MVRKVRISMRPREAATIVLEHFLDRGLVSAAELLRNEYQFTIRPSRNFVVIITNRSSSGWAMKEGRSEVSNRISVEAEFYKAVQQTTPNITISQYMPRLIDYDHVMRRLITEADTNSSTLYEATRISAGNLESALPQLAQALSELHRIMPSRHERFAFQIAAPIPWMINLGELAVTGPRAANPIAERFLQFAAHHHALVPMAAWLKRHWRSNALIHGDLRSSNVLVARAKRLLLVDWELCGWGDARWDVATVISSIIADCHREGVASALQQSSAIVLKFASHYQYLSATRFNQHSSRYLTWCIALRLIQLGFEILQTGASYSARPDALLRIALHLCAKPTFMESLVSLPRHDSKFTMRRRMEMAS